MNLEHMDNSDTSGEIDLGQLLLKISDILGRNWVLIITILVGSLVLGFASHKVSKPSYQSSMVIESRILNYPNGHNLIHTLDRLVQDRNHQMIATRLGLEPGQAAQLAGIEAQDLSVPSDPQEKAKTSIIKITVEVFDNQILADLEKGVVNYLENNPYVKKRIEIEKENLVALKDRINSELEQLNQLKNTLNQEIVSKSSNTHITVIDPANVYRELILLYEAELDTRAQLELINNIEVIEGFTAFKGSSGPGPMVSGLLGMGIGLLLVVIVLIALELRRYLKRLKRSEIK